MKKSDGPKTEGFDALTSAAQAIGSTLGKLAVKTGLVKPAPFAGKKRVAPGKKAVKAAAPATRQTTVGKPATKTARGGKKKP